MKQTLTASEVVAGPASSAGVGSPQGADHFRKGDPVVLTGGPNWGTPAIFLGLRSDPKWADLQESNGAVRAHPVEWMSHSSTA